ncbi:VUT family protein [Taklimakanibacter deserti]|uniref:VUT family protein n=1 Tax=Taklimakanibacter deserti TaxID=2267839 RepID=UPI000E646C8B
MWVVVYIASIVLVNWLFVAVAPWPTAFGDLYLANLVVGFVFVLRDYGQRQVGHKILLATLVAGIITFFMVDRAIALASITAFVLSEMTDWAIYSFTKRPLQQRILLSSLVAVPLDTLAFQYLANYLTPAAFTTEVLSKALGVLIVWYLLKLRADSRPAAAL